MHDATQKRGWLYSYLADGDDLFGHGRLGWWASVELTGKLPEGPIPQIAWKHAADTSIRPGLEALSEVATKKGPYSGPPLSPAGAMKHLSDLIEQMRGGWDSLIFLVRWLAWGLGVGCETEPPMSWSGETEAWDDLLYRKFHLGRLQAADSDILGNLLSEQHGSGWNPNAFYPTPMSVCEMMTQIMMTDRPESPGGKDPRLASVMDPCVGTGRMLLTASNSSVNLWGVDIDPVMVNACSINLALYAPWGVYMGPRGRALLERPYPTAESTQAVIAQADVARGDQGHPSLPTPSDDEKYCYNRHGQGELFSVPPKEGA